MSTQRHVPSQLAHGGVLADATRRGAWWWLALPIVLAVALLALPFAAPRFHTDYLLPEGYGLLELIHFLLPFYTALYTFSLVLNIRKSVNIAVLLLLSLFALGNIYIAGEEQSWGQHFFYWSTPEYWVDLNRQAETNLHNTNSWFNQKPRAVLEIGILLVGLATLPQARARLRRLPAGLAALIPPLSFLPVALVATLVKLAGRLIERLAPDMAFARMSEVHETFVSGVFRPRP